jgi:hypothetical protein
MDVARDLQDHQLVDRDDEPCGRVDDIVIEWDDAGARLGALLSGGGIFLHQLGLVGDVLKRVLRFQSARSHIAIDWRQIRGFAPQHICLLPPRGHIGLRRVGMLGDDQHLLSALLQTPVTDSNAAQMGILDLRTVTPRPPTAPRVIGVLCAQQPRLLLLGLKRHDGGLLPRSRIDGQARFVPWEAIASIRTDGIQLNCSFVDLPLLSDTPDNDPPAAAQEHAE